MTNAKDILKIYKEGFSANIYSHTHFRMIGIIDVDIEYNDGVERVTLAYYSSSGTNNGKIKGLWYPIVGIKMKSGPFTEFTPYLNFILTKTTANGLANRGWLAKSPFFYRYDSIYKPEINGFSNSQYYEKLLNIGETLRDLYKEEQYYEFKKLNPYALNKILTSPTIYPGNKRSQRENFEKFMQDIFESNVIKI